MDFMTDGNGMQPQVTKAYEFDILVFQSLIS